MEKTLVLRENYGSMENCGTIVNNLHLRFLFLYDKDKGISIIVIIELAS